MDRCGKCDNWMKKSDCPKEKVGMKPSCNEFACKEFVLSNLYKVALNEMDIKDEKSIITDDINADLLLLGFDKKEVEEAVWINIGCGKASDLHLDSKVFNYWHGNTRKHTLVRTR